MFKIVRFKSLATLQRKNVLRVAKIGWKWRAIIRAKSWSGKKRRTIVSQKRVLPLTWFIWISSWCFRYASKYNCKTIKCGSRGPIYVRMDTWTGQIHQAICSKNKSTGKQSMAQKCFTNIFDWDQIVYFVRILCIKKASYFFSTRAAWRQIIFLVKLTRNIDGGNYW